METNWEELAGKYQVEAEAYAIVYEDFLRPVRVLSVLQGVVVQMESERLKFEAKRGKSDKSSETGDRINILMDGLDQLSGLAERNLAMKYQIRNKNLQLIAAHKEIEILKKQLAWDESQTQ